MTKQFNPTAVAAFAALALAACGGGQTPTEPATEAATSTPTSQPTSMPMPDAPAAEHGHHGHHGGDGFDRRSMDHHFASPETFAAAWEDPSRDAWQKPDEIAAALGASAGDTVADLGAGTGYLVPTLRAAVGAEGAVIALDVEPAMIDYLETRAADSGWDNVEPRLSTHTDPNLAAGSVAGVVTLNTWHHVADRTAFAERVYAGLRDGGRFVVVDFLAEPTEGHGPPLEMRLGADVVVAELEAAGFAAEVIEETLPRHYIVVATRD